jgi:membrane-associated HD superfamily phosphohydrolase
METNEYYMVILCLCILLIFTLSYKPPNKEGFDIGKVIKNGILKPIQKETTKQFNEAKKKTEKVANDAKKRSEKIANDAKKETTKQFNEAKKNTEKVANDAKKQTTKQFNEAKKETTKGLNVVKKETTKGLNVVKKETTKGLNVVKKEATKGFNVVKKGTEKIANDIKKGFDDILKEIENIANYIVCGFNKIKTLPQCFFWYLLDIIYGVFYLFYLTLVFIIPPLKDIGKMLGKGVKIADGFIYKILGFHLFRYPKEVMKKCYLC